MDMPTFIKTFPLTGYPKASQELMLKIVKDSKDYGIEVINYKGSYSIIRIYDTETAVKILCTKGSSFETQGTGVLVLYRKELVDKINIDEVNRNYPKIDLRKNLVRVGGGTFRDFYYTQADTVEMYLAKKDNILSFAKIIISTKERL